VGPKLAARLVVELKDKLMPFEMTAAALTATPAGKKAGGGNVVEDAVSALVNLGYGRMEAFGAVSRAAQAAGGSAAVGALIKSSLRELGSADGR
jgi:Holliday junction DNA helicase RuvA